MLVYPIILYLIVKFSGIKRIIYEYCKSNTSKATSVYASNDITLRSEKLIKLSYKNIENSETIVVNKLISMEVYSSKTDLN